MRWRVHLVLLAVAFSCMPPPPEHVERVDARLAFIELQHDEFLRTPEGDLALPLPPGWTLLPLASDLADGTIGVVLDSAMTAAVVVQRVQPTEAIAAALDRGDVRGLARACFERRLQRTGNTIRLLSDFRLVARDSMRLGTYEFVENVRDTTTHRRTRVAVVPTSIGGIYEVALSPLVLSLDRVPEERMLDSVFVYVMQILRVP
ncbi:MAG: hypothetical protein KatS3mg038_0668 [Candidatus Kapaibacterium sp.]|nr:MAG: hypothetical protein KatS3mg038_0668 [Candidatus Kapabacteria bacterium]